MNTPVLIFGLANGGKEPRGIRGYAITGGNTTFSHWKLQGNQVHLHC